MKRGLASSWVYSALAMSRRRQLQLSRVVHMNAFGIGALTCCAWHLATS
jgi:hypothetical protein